MTRRLTPDEQQQVTKVYRLGKSTYALARQFGTDRHTITRHLRRGGVTLRSRQKLTPELAEQAKQLYADNYSLAAIGKQVGLTPTAVSNALQRAGVQLRRRHAPQDRDDHHHRRIKTRKRPISQARAELNVVSKQTTYESLDTRLKNTCIRLPDRWGR
jgi:DNA invertase Pin-like site-specific DNA recombinase